MRSLLFIAATAVILAACSKPDQPNKASNDARLTQQKQEVQSTLRAGPQTRTWQTPEGALVELTIPRASLTGRSVEYQRCVVWRDATTKTAFMHCDRDNIDLADHPTDPPDYSNLR